MRSLKRASFLLCLLFYVLPSFALIKLPQLVGNGMVLQRNVPIHIWGWGDAGEKVTLIFNHHRYRTITGQKGEWKVVLPAMKAGGPYTMQISGKNQILITDILLGDVWFCSGQSNMVLNMERVKERYPHEIATADLPQVRNFFISTEADVQKQHGDLLPGKWVKCDPVTVLGFGAASWFFARQLYAHSHVATGIINSSVGGTPIQAWISRDGFDQGSAFNSRIMQFSSSIFMDSLLKAHSAWRNPLDTAPLGNDLGLTGPEPWFDPTYIPLEWHHFWLPGYWSDQGIKDLNGVVWFRKEIELPAALNGKTARLYLGRIVDADQSYINGHLIGSTTYQYPPRRYEVPAGLLKSGKNILMVRVVNTSGKGGFVADKPYYLAAGKDTLDLRGDWQYKVGQAFDPIQVKPEFSAQNEPAGLYNTMVAPVIPYTIKGFLWYQGESNTGNAAAYGGLLKRLILDWRAKWGQGNLPFIYAQLPDFNEVRYSPAESDWAELRDGQLKALDLPVTAMAVTLDAGEWNDIHPLNKEVIGERLALAAEHIAYGNTHIVSSGPVFKTAYLDGNTIKISFTSTGSGLMVRGGDELSQFSIAGADRKFIWAHARIEGDRVSVSNDKIIHPLYVRYAWADNPQGANLSNKEGLPASPFRTDQP